MSGCTFHQYTHINQLPHDPAFEEGGEATTAFNIHPYGGNLQASVSPVNYTGITGGFYKGIGKRWAWNYGAMVYVPVYRKDGKKIYLSFHAEKTRGIIRGIFKEEDGFLQATNVFRADVNYRGYNLRSSVYRVMDGKSAAFRVGLTYGLVYTNYSRLFVDERNIKADGDTLGLTGGADGKNINFYGSLFNLFIEGDMKKFPFGIAITLGYAPHIYNYRQLGFDAVQNQRVKFEGFPYLSMCIRFRVNKLYSYFGGK